MNPFVFLFCLKAHQENTSVRVSMTNGTYSESCLITGLSPWHLELKYYLKNTNSFVRAIVDGKDITDVFIINKVEETHGALSENTRAG